MLSNSPLLGLSTPAACAALLAALTLAVVFTMLVENWPRLVVPLTPEQPLVPYRTAPSPVAALSTWSNDQVTAALLAAYCASKRPAASRVAAWVTADECPPSLDEAMFKPGASFRGKPGRVTALARADDDERCWVALNTSVDIQAGLRRSSVKDETLTGLLLWWQCAQSGGPIEAASVPPFVAAVEQVIPAVADTPVAAVLAPVLSAARGAQSIGSSFPLAPQ
jgi:hypothetical protein